MQSIKNEEKAISYNIFIASPVIVHNCLGINPIVTLVQCHTRKGLFAVYKGLFAVWSNCAFALTSSSV